MDNSLQETSTSRIRAYFDINSYRFDTILYMLHRGLSIYQKGTGYERQLSESFASYLKITQSHKLSKHYFGYNIICCKFLNVVLFVLKF